MTRVSFDYETESTSHDRARNEPYHVVLDPSGESYLIAFEDGENVHEVTHELTPEGYEADCLVVYRDDDKFKRCPGFAHHSGPCAHIWAVHLHIGQERRTDDDERYNAKVERLRADGGRRR